MIWDMYSTMLANYHTHTVRCGHASGTDREYVEAAIEGGLKTLGFSDHIPMPFPDGHDSRFRVPSALLEDYVQSVLSLREEYKDRIDIRLGFEAEYYPDLFEDMLEMLSAFPMDYLLLGQHFNDSLETVYNGRPQSDPHALSVYADRVISGMETGCFTYVAHPDLFRYTGPEQVYRQEMGRICRSAAMLDIPLEINLLGMRENRHYPDDVFWSVAAEHRCRAILGCDAHRPGDTAHPEQVNAALAYAARFGLVPETDVVLKKPF